MFVKQTEAAKKSFYSVIERMKNNNLSVISDMATITIPSNAICIKNGWSFKNTLLAMATTGTPMAATYKQWQELGRQVTEKGAGFIFNPIMGKVEDENGDVKYVRKGYRTCAVFSIDKTEPIEGFEGETIEPIELQKTKPQLFDLAKKLDIKIDYDYYAGDGLGSCNIEGTKIVLRSEDSEVFWHELAHAIDAKIKGGLIKGQNKHQETVAELTACVIADIYGEDITGNAWNYIKCYNKDPLTAISKAAEDVKQILDYLFKSE